MTIKLMGEPVGKGRPKFTKNGHAYTPEKTRAYEDFIKWAWKQQVGNIRFAEDLPLAVEILAIFKIPKSASKAKREKMLNGEITVTKKPDIDNIVKIILDGLNGVAYYDDKQVIQVKASKTYGNIPQVWVSVKEM